MSNKHRIGFRSMECATEAGGRKKAFVGDWAENAEGAEGYDSISQAVRVDNNCLLQFYSTAFLPLQRPQVDVETRQPRRSRCLDVGCGPGRLTVEYLLPTLPTWCEKLVAVDNSEPMLRFAQERYPHPKVQYKRLDIAVDEDVARFRKAEGCFEMIYSFGALHWIRDQNQALRNIGKLMAPGGECFVTFSASMLLFDIITAAMERQRWKRFSEQIRHIVPITNAMDIGSLRSYSASLLNATDLTPLTCEVFLSSLDLSVSVERFANFCTTANPLHHVLPTEEKQELQKFTQEFLLDWVKKNSGKLINDFKRIVIHAHKKCM